MIKNHEDQIIFLALNILKNRLRDSSITLKSAGEARSFLSLKLGEREQEVFAVMFLDSAHSLISFDEMFFGTIDGASVYPREVAKLALAYNAAAVVLAHNHPSKGTTPSQADMRITERLTEALELIDVRVLDHIIVGGINTTSFAEQGLL